MKTNGEQLIGLGSPLFDKFDLWYCGIGGKSSEPYVCFEQ
jgi:hypothetical protein